MISCLSALSPHICIRRGLENFRIKESEEKIPQVPGVSHGILPFFSLDPFSFPPKCTGAKKKKKHRKSPVQKTFFNIFTTQYSKVWQIRSCAFFAHEDTPALRGRTDSRNSWKRALCRVGISRLGRRRRRRKEHLTDDPKGERKKKIPNSALTSVSPLFSPLSRIMFW